MTRDEMMDEILVDGFDDWVYSPVVFGCVQAETGLSGEPLVRATMGLIHELLGRGLMEVGDTLPEFKAWSVPVPEAFARIERDWRAAGVDTDFVAICWFANTPAGNARAEQVIANQAREP
ncbi:hypothetical protein [Chondromyces crocatus]|uniref:Uncharacterized protein n=1 Tax=Chondromyces crocatus TaxID=52 RepID=A0A0K1ES33_CHOCO|nr:hypothetical protein [Chondromyces crocatus]AKT43467.1 uncharacterized protein CMC5_076990 [Chondromyces crocatus]